jgi:hypothetical protein
MHEEPIQPFAATVFPSAAFPPPPPSTAVPNDPLPTSAEFESMKRNFEAATIQSSPPDKKSRYPSSNGSTSYPTPAPTMSAGSSSQSGGSAFVDIYGGAQMYTSTSFQNAAAPPFIPAALAAQQMQASGAVYSNPSSPYLGVNSQFGTPSSTNGQLPQLNDGASSYSPYDTMPSSPNPYANNNGAFADAFMGMMASPQMQSSPLLGGGMDGFIGGFMGMGQRVGGTTHDSVRPALLFLFAWGPID